jgi:CDP-glycerol glycerophosphotransferase
MIPDTHHTAGIDWPQQLRRFEDSGRVALARSADVSPLLAAANLLVTDHSTVGFEFALLDRPIVVFDAPELLHAARIAPERWDALRAMADVARTTSELRQLVPAALASPGRLQAQRQSARHLFAHPGGATARALATVYDLLDLPHPVSGSDPARVAASVRARG